MFLTDGKLAIEEEGGDDVEDERSNDSGETNKKSVYNPSSDVSRQKLARAYRAKTKCTLVIKTVSTKRNKLVFDLCHGDHS